MKAIVVEDFDRSPPFVLADIPEPNPGPEEIRIRVHAASLNFGDTVIMSGKYQVRPKLPFIGGAECAGVVDAVGEFVTGIQVGDHVCAHGFVERNGENTILGAYAQKVVLPQSAAVKIPHGVPLSVAAILLVSYETSFHALRQRANLKAGETLLVLGASGGTGFAAIAIGKYLGAKVIASASSEEKRRIALNAGAYATIDSTSPEWRKLLAQATDNEGIDVVFDPVGGDESERAFRSLRRNGRHLVVGFAAGQIPRIPTNLALVKAISLVGVNNHRFLEDEPEAAEENRQELFQALTEESIAAPTDVRAFKLEEFDAAFAYATQRGKAGRILIDIGGE